jgi:hypothetical protein
MKRSLLSILIIIAVFAGCKKDEAAKTAGTETIDNTLAGTASAGYYAYGFLFSQAKKVSTNSNPKPDITFDNDGTLLNLILQTNNFKSSFYKIGEYASAALAEQAFKSLTTFTVPQWVEWGYQVKPNQIWLFMTSSEHYAKIRIISTVSESRSNVNYAECTFQWVYQPDGSLTFPGK